MVSLNRALRRALYQLGVYCRVRMHRGRCGGHWGARTGGMGARAASRESAMAARLSALLRRRVASLTETPFLPGMTEMRLL